MNNMDIFRYKQEHEDAVIEAIKEDPNWEIFTAEGAIDKYRKRLHDSITYVCYEGEMFAGYVRAILDDGFAIYISESMISFKDRSFGANEFRLEDIEALRIVGAAKSRRIRVHTKEDLFKDVYTDPWGGRFQRAVVFLRCNLPQNVRKNAVQYQYHHPLPISDL